MKSKRTSPQSQALLEQKRREAKILREAGLFKRRAGRITDKYLRESSYFRKVRRELKDVIAGFLKPVKIKPLELSKFKQAGYQVRKGRVIVPTATTPARVKSIAKQLPPPPRRPRGPRVMNRETEECLHRVVEWLTYNFDPRIDDLDERIERLKQRARENPNTFRDVINASNLQGQLYLTGRPAVSNPWPAGPIAEIFYTEFPELYYYHPNSYDYATVGGLIPKC